jgi:hypothetical protein
VTFDLKLRVIVVANSWRRIEGTLTFRDLSLDRRTLVLTAKGLNEGSKARQQIKRSFDLRKVLMENTKTRNIEIVRRSSNWNSVIDLSLEKCIHFTAQSKGGFEQIRNLHQN